MSIILIIKTKLCYVTTYFNSNSITRIISGVTFLNNVTKVAYVIK